MKHNASQEEAHDEHYARQGKAGTVRAVQQPHLTTAKRGEVSQTAWVGIFNLMLSRWHTGGPWEGLPVAKDRQAREQGNEPS
jgi:hypothetical protein